MCHAICLHTNTKANSSRNYHRMKETSDASALRWHMIKHLAVSHVTRGADSRHATEDESITSWRHMKDKYHPSITKRPLSQQDTFRVVKLHRFLLHLLLAQRVDDAPVLRRRRKPLAVSRTDVDVYCAEVIVFLMTCTNKTASFAASTLSLPRVISDKFPLQPHQKHYIRQYEELGIS